MGRGRKRKKEEMREMLGSCEVLVTFASPDHTVIEDCLIVGKRQREQMRLREGDKGERSIGECVWGWGKRKRKRKKERG